MTSCSTERLLNTQLFAAFLRSASPSRVKLFAADLWAQADELERDGSPETGSPEDKAEVAEVLKSLASALIRRTSG